MKMVALRLITLYLRTVLKCNRFGKKRNLIIIPEMIKDIVICFVYQK